MRGVGAIAAFAKQVDWCATLGSPFMAALCDALPRVLDRTTATGRRVLDWPGNAFADALPIRVAGGLHALVRSGAAPDLAALYPPATLDAGALVGVLRRTIARHDDALRTWLDRAPQTNEVMRSAVLMPGMLAIADATGLPLRVFELGPSAGLNLRLDAYAYDLGGRVIETSGAPIRLVPEWRGPPPPAAQVRIVERRGGDLAPIDVTDAAARERLLAYVWPDQPVRLARLAAALDAAAADPPPIDRAEAADWTERHVAPVAGAVTVLFHSIAYQYFVSESRARIAGHMDRAGAAATAAAPLAWLRFEMDDASEGVPPALRLRLWPGGEDRLLACAHPHGSVVDWRLAG
jgi:hypothetical protein